MSPKLAFSPSTEPERIRKEVKEGRKKKKKKKKETPPCFLFNLHTERFTESSPPATSQNGFDKFIHQPFTSTKFVEDALSVLKPGQIFSTGIASCRLPSLLLPGRGWRHERS